MEEPAEVEIGVQLLLSNMLEMNPKDCGEGLLE